MNTRCLAVIPSRYPSSRLPAKPLKDIAGKTLLQRVWEQACKAKSFAKVVVATDDERIYDHARSFGAESLMTSSEHATGSDRVAETWERMKAAGEQYDFVANVQGDMPFISPQVIDQCVETLRESSPRIGMSTIATPLLSEDEFQRPSAVKVALGVDNIALYFSRSPIPFWRERINEEISESNPFGYKHMGLYVFRPETLEVLKSLKPALPEHREKLEQLRVISNGIAIRVAVIPLAAVGPSIEVDTPDDLERARWAAKEFDARGNG